MKFFSLFNILYIYECVHEAKHGYNLCKYLCEGFLEMGGMSIGKGFIFGDIFVEC